MNEFADEWLPTVGVCRSVLNALDEEAACCVIYLRSTHSVERALPRLCPTALLA
jgi:hypothetical protein